MRYFIGIIIFGITLSMPAQAYGDLYCYFSPQGYQRCFNSFYACVQSAMANGGVCTQQ